MPKSRKPENKGLPKSWQIKHAAYYYRVPKGMESRWDGKQMFRLGSTLPEAYRVWAERLDRQQNVRNISSLLDRYSMEIIPKKSPKSQTEQYRHLTKLRVAFGDMELTALVPKHIYQYVDKRSQKVKSKVEDDKRIYGGVTAAHREIATLSFAFTKAVEWGYVDRHPFKGEIRLVGENPRTRYIEDWEIEECLNLPSFRKQGSVKAVQAYIRLKLLTALRRGDLLRLKLSDIGDNGISITVNKTKKRIIYEWTPALREAVEMAKAARPVDISGYLFCNKLGKCYMNEETGEANGWDSMWKRFMVRVLKETKVEEHFTEHDIRAKISSDQENVARAQELLGHSDPKTTSKFYRRKPSNILPAK